MIVRAVLLVAAGILAVLLDTVVLADLTVAGVAPSTATVVVLAVAFIDGPGPGMRVGFGVGLLLDLVGEGLVGVSALLLVLAAYGVGIGRRLWTGGQLTGRLLAGGLGAAGVSLGHLILALVFSQTETSLAAAAGQVVVDGLFGLLLTPLIMPAIGWVSRQLTAREATGL